MNEHETIEFAFSWFDEEQWQLLKALDPVGLDDTYEEWRKNANDSFSDFEKNGQKVRKLQ